MNLLNSTKTKNLIILFLFLFVLVFSPFLILSYYRINRNNHENVKLINNNIIKPKDLLNLEDLDSDHNKDEIYDWNKLMLRSDQNTNGISDILEQKLNLYQKNSDFTERKQLLTSEAAQEILQKKIYGINTRESNSFSSDNIPVIIQFPEGDYSSASLIFQKLGGKINSEYRNAINGFAGSINHNALIEFSDFLRKEGKLFYIEEDGGVEGHLYYASRNMNLRPYVWNILNGGYDGDEWSSIAILDSGIDDDHSFYESYGDADFSKKIVGWKDTIHDELMPYDDGGHGSHVAGIAAGDGDLNYDGQGRAVSTYPLDLDFFLPLPEVTIELALFKFNVTEAGKEVEIECNFTDFTPKDSISLSDVSLYHESTLKNRTEVFSQNWVGNISYTPSEIGEHTLRITIDLIDKTGDGYVDDFHFGFRAITHWPYNLNQLGCGSLWKGVAPDTHLVGVKVMYGGGYGSTSHILEGIDWVINHKESHNITVMSMSIGGSAGYINMIDAVDNAVEEGIVVVVSAGNSGGDDENNIGSPGDADKVITVAAMNNADGVTEYSSSGGPSWSMKTIKPDIMAPGGSLYEFLMYSADTNDVDKPFLSEGYVNDTYQAMGTSMSAPAVAGAANLLIEAMGGQKNWDYDDPTMAKRVKALLLMTATETYPIQREEDTEYSPTLERGGKDIHEGYGRMNVDAAIEAWINELTAYGKECAWLTSSQINPFNKHALGCYVDLVKGENYRFNLTVPGGADFDLHLYSSNASIYGEPIMVASSTFAIDGMNELISYTASETGKYFLVAKVISGEGYANISYQPNIIAPILSNEKFEPTSGIDPTTLLNFSVVYTDPDGIGPSYVNISINETYYMLEKQDPNDLDYTDGCVYQYLTYLQPGNYNYTFGCKDGRFYFTTKEYDDLTVGEKTDYLPTLNNGQVSPSFGYNDTTLFIFTVNYADLDNYEPDYVNITVNSTTYTMVKKDPTDINYMDGCIYTYTTLLSELGTYNFHINCTDDDITVITSGVYSGPIVKDTNTLENYRMIPNYIYEWIDASDGVRLLPYNNYSQKFNLPFNFQFYNETFDYIYVCTNGFASFLDENEHENTIFPTSDYKLMIAPFWDNLDFVHSNIFIKNLTSPNRVVIEWFELIVWSDRIEIMPGLYFRSGDDLTFEIVLYESGDILFNYEELTIIRDYTCGLNFGKNISYYNSYSKFNADIKDFAILFTVWPNDYVPPSGGGAGGGGDDDDDDGEDKIDPILIITIVAISSAVGVAIVASIGFIKYRKSKLFRERVLKAYREQQNSNH